MLAPAEQAAELAPILLQRLRAARERAGLSQADAARLLGITHAGGHGRLAKIERGAIETPMWLVMRACRVYDVSADYLLGSTDQPRPKRMTPAPITEAACRLIRTPEQRRADADALIDSARHLKRLRRVTEAMMPMADELAAAQAEVEAQDAWQDVRGGARWAANSGKAAELMTRARQLALL